MDTYQISTALHSLYLAQLPKTRRILRKICDDLQLGVDTDSNFKNLINEAHRIAGTAATYGYPKISASAAILEDKARLDLNNPHEIYGLVAAVLDDIDAAIQSGSANVGAKEPEPVPKASEPERTKRIHYRPLILVADDDIHVQSVLTEILSAEANVQCVSYGRQAVTAISRRRFDMVVLDHELPDMNGFEVLAAAKKDIEVFATPVMMLTAARSVSKVVQLLAAGARNYVAKPFQPQAIVSRIRSILYAEKPLALVADDDPLIREILRHKLARRGVRSLTASSGVEALEMMRRWRPHVLILDRSMPRMDGLEVLAELRREADISSTPVIVLSALNTPDEIDKGYDSGADDYIVKPFLPDDVIDRSLRLVESKRIAV